MLRRRNPFPGVSTGPDRHGKLRHRLKRTVNGRKVDCYLPGPCGSPEFRAAYEEACEGIRLAGRRARPGTVGYLIEAYLGSKGYLRLADSTRRDVRGRLDWIRDAIGGAKYAKIEPRHVAALMEKKGGPTAANRLRKDLGQLYRFAGKRLGYRGPNPAALADAHKTKNGRLSHLDERGDRDFPGRACDRKQGAAGAGNPRQHGCVPRRRHRLYAREHRRRPGPLPPRQDRSSKSTCRSCRSSAASCPTSRLRRWCCCPARTGRRATPTNRSVTYSAAGARKPGCRALRRTVSERPALGVLQRPERPNLK